MTRRGTLGLLTWVQGAFLCWPVMWGMSLLACDMGISLLVCDIGISLLVCDMGDIFAGMWIYLAGDILKAVMSSNS